MLPLRNLTVGEQIKATAERYPERPALEYCGRIWNYRELDMQTDELAAGLLSVGMKKGMHLAIWANANSSTIFFLYAAQKIGAVPIMINPGLCKSEISEMLSTAGADFLALGDRCDNDSLSTLPDQFPGKGKTASVLSMENGKNEYPGPLQLQQAGRKLPPALLARAEKNVVPQDPALILFTSGVTSEPKAVVTSHYSRVNSGIQQAHDLKATERDRFCVAMPLFHCFCLTVNVMAALAVGGCLYLPKSRHTADLRDAFRIGRCTILSSVPTIFHALISKPSFCKEDYKTLRIGMIGGSTYPSSLFRRIEQEMDFTLLASLGQTEATAGITVSSPEDSLEVRSTTIGRFMAHVEGRIVDHETGKELPCGGTGEICVRGYLVMMGYYMRPDLTRNVIDENGWLHTGDAGWLDENGYLHFNGRIKELIIRGGENISPAEVEQCILENSCVAECKVVGVPDEHYGEEVCACVVLAPGKTLTLEALRPSLSERLADFKLPRYLLCLDRLPRTSMGKVSSNLLLDVVKEKLFKKS